MGPRRYVPFAVRFHLAPDVSASVARDKRSVLLRAGSEAGWWLLDYIDVVVHVFTPDTREYYRLEQLWGEAQGR